MKEGNSMKHGTLDGYIESLEWFYYVTNTREYGENSVKRGGWALEDTTVGHYLSEVIIADLIMKNENRIWPRYIPRIKNAVEAVLSRSPELDSEELEPDEWDTLTKIAERVKENLPNIRIVPDGKEF